MIMIVADIISFLGNQLFIYAATKSIALDLGYKYRYRVLKPTWTFGKNETINEIGHQYIYDFEKAFHIDTTERIEGPIQLENSWTWARLPNTNYNDKVYGISDNTHFKGHFLSPQYFEHRRKEVEGWFAFRDEYLENGYNRLKQIKETCKATHIISIHMRYGNYRREGLALDPSYYRNSVLKIRELFCDRELGFILFSDEPKESMALLSMNDITIVHGNMLDDLCLMTLCDGHIISNSTFAWWGAWLSDSKIVIRPSIWAIADGKLGPDDVYPSHWVSVQAEREKMSLNNSLKVWSYKFNRDLKKSFARPYSEFRKIVKNLVKIKK